MSANLFGERFMSYRVPAWHNLGKVFEDRPTAEEAVVRAGVDFKVTKEPLVVSVDIAPFGVQMVPVAGKSVLVREPVEDDQQYRVFGMVSDQYEVIQNKDLAAMVDQLTDGWRVETVGSLGMGESVFIVLDSGDSFKVKGDKSEIRQYFLLTDTKDGKTSLRIAFTPVRVVCQNTLTVGLAQASVRADLAHVGGLTASLDVRLKLLKKLQDAKSTSIASFQAMATAILTTEQVLSILEVAYPEPSKPKNVQTLESYGEEAFADLGDELVAGMRSAQSQWEYYVKQAHTRREETLDRFKLFGEEFHGAANTGWALYNAVVENEDFRDGPSTMFESAVFGQRANTKQRAFKAVMEHVKTS